MILRSGKKVITEAIAENIPQDVINMLFRRHMRGDWGDVSEEDKRANQEAQIYGGQIFSGYFTGYGKIYIITDENRISTKIFFADEYKYMMGSKNIAMEAFI